jgi:GDPmannose 4,6-dehydratase
MTRAHSALIVGARGQDGRLLGGLLRGQGVDVFGLDSDGTVTRDGVVIGEAAIDDADTIARLVESIQPRHVYYLAAYHHSSENVAGPEPDVWRRSFAVHCDGLVAVLEAVARYAPLAHVVYASSSHVFGEPATTPQDEETPLRPTSPYAVSKAAGMGICASYRLRGIRASAAILFNHESPFRRPGFVVPRVVRAVAEAAERGERVVRLEVGNPDAVVDWSWAEDVVRALDGIASQDEPGVWVVASGVARTVRELGQVAAAHVGLEATMVADAGTPLRKLPLLVGNPSRLRDRIPLPAPVPFAKWVGRMVDVARSSIRAQGALS